MAPQSSSEVRAQLVAALELELLGPTQRVLEVLDQEVEGLENESLDRLPSSWYPTGFLVPTETDLSLKCDDTADDDFAAADGVDLRKPKKANSEYKPGSGDDGCSSESAPAKPQLFPSSIGLTVLLPPSGELQLVARWGDYVRLAAEGATMSAFANLVWHGCPWRHRPAVSLPDTSVSCCSGCQP